LLSFLKSDMPTKTSSVQPLRLFSAALLLSAGSAFAQSAACPAMPTHQATPAEVAYQQTKYESAETLFRQALLQEPNDPELNIALVHTLLHENRISDAWTGASRAAESNPRSRALSPLWLKCSCAKDNRGWPRRPSIPLLQRTLAMHAPT
jgi:predicted Zn-dependent protease